MTLDPEILALVGCSQRGETVPEIPVLTSGMWIVGRPAAAEAFADAMRQGKIDELAVKHMPANGWRGLKKVTMEDARREVEGLADEHIRPLREVSDTNNDSLTLLDARVLPPQGDGLQLAAVRISCSSIDAWWLGIGKVIKAGSATFFAVSYPLPS